MKLWKKPEITGKKDKPFTLTGDVISLFSKNRKLERVIARANATAVSDSMTLKSDTIDLRIRNDVLDHAYAWGAKGQGRATRGVADAESDRRLARRPHAGPEGPAGSSAAKGVRRRTSRTRRASRPTRSDRNDWLRGDTIVAHFDTATAKDTSKAPTIRQLLASGHASSYYHLAPSDSGERRPAIDYLIARLITIDFNKQQASPRSRRSTRSTACTSSLAPTPRSGAPAHRPVRRNRERGAEADIDRSSPTEEAVTGPSESLAFACWLTSLPEATARRRWRSTRSSAAPMRPASSISIAPPRCIATITSAHCAPADATPIARRAD